MLLEQSNYVAEADAIGDVPLPYFSLKNGTMYAV